MRILLFIKKSKRDRINFQIFLVNLLDELQYFLAHIYENSMDFDEILENITVVQKVLNGFFRYCGNNDFEIAIIFKNDIILLQEFLNYYNFNLAYKNNLIILDDNTDNIKLENFVEYLLKICNITRSNLINYFLSDWEIDESYVYNVGTFENGKLNIIHQSNENFHFPSELYLMDNCDSIIDVIIYLFKVRKYNCEKYYDLLNEKRRERIEFNEKYDRAVENYRNK